MTDPQNTIYTFGDHRFDCGSRVLYGADGGVVPLMPKAVDTLTYLVKNSGRVVTKDELFAAIWPDTVVEENNLTQNISALRRVLGEKPGEHRYIVTIPGQGYKFVAKVDTEAATSESDDHSDPQLNFGSTPTSRNGPGRIRPVVFVSLAVAALLSLGFYFWWPSKETTLPVRTAAVLPFKPLVKEARNEPIEFGMADGLISRLSAGDSLIVRPISSVKRFTSPDEDIVAAGRTLVVDAVLDGNIDVSTDRVRVSARLFRVSDGKQIWSTHFDEDRKDLSSIQDSIAEGVAAVLNIRLSKAGSKLAAGNPEAYENYMLGRYHALRLVMPEVKKGISYYERSIVIDPNYAPPYVGIAEAQRALVMSNDVDPQLALPVAKIAARRAIELDPYRPESHLALAMVTFWYDWDWEQAEKHFARAVELDPNNVEALLFHAHLLSNTGRHEQALAEVRRARMLDPVNLLVRSLEGMFLDHAGQNDLAVSNLQTAVGLDPNFWLSNHMLSASLISKRSYSEAIRFADEAKRLAPFQTHSLVYKGVAHAGEGNAAETRKILNEMLQSSRDRYVPPCHIAMLYAALRENEKALDYLERGFSEKDLRMVFLKVEPRWDGLRAKPRFIELMRRMNFQ